MLLGTIRLHTDAFLSLAFSKVAYSVNELPEQPLLFSENKSEAETRRDETSGGCQVFCVPLHEGDV